MSNPLALCHLPQNHLGRDFIVGDLHGMRCPLDLALTQVGFDPAQDRLLSVGDLVDRGPDPLGCLRLLREPWFHAVRGNHERMLLAHLGYPETWITRFQSHRYSRPWVQRLSPAEREELIQDLGPRVADLPLALKIATSTQPVYVLHAERQWHGRVLTDAELDAALNRPLGEVPRSLREALTWSRQGISRAQGGRDEAGTEGVSPTYVGHTITPPLTFHQHIYLDRGAYQRSSDDPLELTCLP